MMNANNPTPEKLTAYGFAAGKEGNDANEWRRFDGRQLHLLHLYETGFDLSISTGYAGVSFMRFAPSSAQFFDELMLSIGS